MQTALYQNTQLKSLTGLRFLAAFAVFIAHIPGHWQEYDFGKAPIGAAGVSFFFVLSGFILAYVYVPRFEKSSSGKFPIKEFYLRRVARIWPLHLVTLLIALLGVMGWQAFWKQDHTLAKSVLNIFLLQAWVPNHKWGYFLNGPAWSLSVEVFFYAVFPLFLIGGVKRFVLKYLTVVLATILCVFLIGVFGPGWGSAGVQFDSLIRNLPPMRCFEFASGVACGMLFLSQSQKSRRSSALDTGLEFLAVALVVLFFLVSSWLGFYRHEQSPGVIASFNYWYRFSGATPVFSVLILVFATSRGWLSWFLSSRLFVYLGEISYSFYMVHMTVLLVIVRFDRIEGSWVAPLQIACGLGISLACASILYHLVEVPFRKAIVARVDPRGRSSFIQTLGTSWRAEMAISKIAGIGVVLLVCVMGVRESQFNCYDTGRAAAIIESSPDEFKNVRFGDDAILLGIRLKQGDDSGVAIEAVWKLNSGRRKIRFLNLLDQENQVIGRGDPNRTVFHKAGPQEMIIDRVSIKPAQMDGVEKIAIGFFESGRGFAMVDKGPRNLKMQQLYVWMKPR